MKVTSEKLLDLLYNRKLPQVYRVADKELMTFPLKRYLQSLIEGGYCGSIEDIEKMLTLVDPKSVPEEFLPYLCECFGLPYFKDINPIYTRRFLMNYGELYRRRGTYSCIRFLVRVLTGMDVKMSYIRGLHEDKMGRHLIIELQAKTIADFLNMDTSIEVVKQFVKLFIPYYIHTYVESAIANQVATEKHFYGCAVSPRPSYSMIGLDGPRIVKVGPRLKRSNLVANEVSYKFIKNIEVI